MFRIVRIDHLVLRVRDLGIMMDFYLQTLGCTLERQEPELGLYQLRAGTSLIDLVPVNQPLGLQGGKAPESDGHNLDHLCLRIEPFEAEPLLTYLLSKGLQPSAIESRYGAEGRGPSIYIQDPEGNVVELKGPPATNRVDSD